MNIMKTRIGIIGAMDLEIEKLTKKEMNSENIITKAGLRFHIGKLGDTDVVIVRSGIGKVNAALCAQILIDCFQVTHLINTGIAGSLDHSINIGDIVIGTDAMHHDLDLSPLGYDPGILPTLGDGPVLSSFPADPFLRSLAARACRDAAPDIGVHEGRIVSGDQFISSSEQRSRLVNTFHAICTEMEGAAIAHTAYLNDIPFVILRAISDKAGDEADVEFGTFEHKAAENCANVLAHMVRDISRAQ